MNTTETLISPECTAITTQPQNTLVKPIKFPNQPQEWKIISLRECPTPEEMQQPSVERAFFLRAGVGYVRVASFDEQTGMQIKEAPPIGEFPLYNADIQNSARERFMQRQSSPSRCLAAARGEKRNQLAISSW